MTAPLETPVVDAPPTETPATPATAKRPRDHLLMLIAYGEGDDGKTETWAFVSPVEAETGCLTQGDNIRERARVFSNLRRDLKGARCGAIYRVGWDDEKTLSYTKKQRPELMWPNVSDRMTWGAASEARMAQLRAQKALDAEGKRSWHEYAEPLRKIYLHTPAPARDQFLAQLVAYLSRYRSSTTTTKAKRGK